MSSRSSFGSDKKRVLKDLDTALANHSIDPKVIPILEIINSHPELYSTSSCSGRIFLLALARPGAKKDSMIIEKWHSTASKTQLTAGIAKWNKFPYLYFLAQSPIFHITTFEIETAIHLRNLGDAAGFKYSSIRSMKPLGKGRADHFRITVELLSTERLNIPIGKDGKIFVDDDYLELVLDLANSSVKEADDKLKRLEEILREKLIF